MTVHHPAQSCPEGPGVHWLAPITVGWALVDPFLPVPLKQDLGLPLPVSFPHADGTLGAPPPAKGVGHGLHGIAFVTRPPMCLLPWSYLCQHLCISSQSPKKLSLSILRESGRWANAMFLPGSA